MEWKTIETAPIDGAQFFGQNWRTGQRGILYRNKQWEWELIDGMTNTPMGIGFYPTHWMPLPNPPSKQE